MTVHRDDLTKKKTFVIGTFLFLDNTYRLSLKMSETFPKQESCDCQNLIRREVERAGLVGLDGAIRMSGDPGSLL